MELNAREALMCCKGCERRWVKRDEDGIIRTCHASCPEYAAAVRVAEEIRTKKREEHLIPLRKTPPRSTWVNYRGGNKNNVY